MIDQLCAAVAIQGACPFMLFVLRALGVLLLAGLVLIAMAVLVRAVMDSNDRGR